MTQENDIPDTLRLQASGPRLGDDDLNSFEQRSGRTIPTAYRRFLLAHNGGRPDQCHFSVPGSDRRLKVDWFLGVTGGIDQDDDLEENLEVSGPTLPPGQFPIGCDYEGKYICLRTRTGPGAGAVFLYDLETWILAAEPDATKLLLLAPDLRTFLRGLRVEP